MPTSCQPHADLVGGPLGVGGGPLGVVGGPLGGGGGPLGGGRGPGGDRGSGGSGVQEWLEFSG